MNECLERHTKKTLSLLLHPKTPNLHLINVACMKTSSVHTCVLCNFLITSKPSFIIFLAKPPNCKYYILTTLIGKMVFQCGVFSYLFLCEAACIFHGQINSFYTNVSF